MSALFTHDDMSVVRRSLVLSIDMTCCFHAPVRCLHTSSIVSNAIPPHHTPHTIPVTPAVRGMLTLNKLTEMVQGDTTTCAHDLKTCSYHVAMSSRIVSCRVVPCRVVLCRVVLCHIT